MTALLDDLTEKLRDGGRFDIQCSYDGAVDEIPEVQTLCILKVVQEALVNVARHSNGRNVKIAISNHGDVVHGSVWDDGTTCCHCKEGLGLTLMRERIQRLGGTMDVSTKGAKGFQIDFALPLSRGGVA